MGGQVFSTDGVAVALTGNCATDDFSVSNAPGIPQICGTLTGDHGKEVSWGFYYGKDPPNLKFCDF